MVVIDFGVRFQGYHSDETKTVILGKPDGQQKKIYDLVRRAQERAMKAIRPGVSVRRIDGAARDVISRGGYGKFFGHGTGHGIGLAVHEPPTISPRGRGVVEEGMVFTVEPGIYIPGWGGVRLEDMVLVTDRGCEVLTVSFEGTERQHLSRARCEYMRLTTAGARCEGEIADPKHLNTLTVILERLATELF